MSYTCQTILHYLLFYLTLIKCFCSVVNEAFEHLTSSDPDQFWTSGQWMTEQASGSDVSFATRTIALPITSSTSLARSEENPLSISIPGHEIRSCAPFTTHIGTQSNLASSGKRGEVFPLTGWNQGATHLLYGLKWFTSAVDAAVAVTLARIVPPGTDLISYYIRRNIIT